LLCLKFTATSVDDIILKIDYLVLGIKLVPKWHLFRDTQCSFVDGMTCSFHIMVPIMARDIGNIYVSDVLEHVVINFQRIRQVAPHCSTLLSCTVGGLRSGGAITALRREKQRISNLLSLLTIGECQCRHDRLDMNIIVFMVT